MKRRRQGRKADYSRWEKCDKGNRIGGEMRSKVGTAKSAQHTRQTKNECSPALEENPGEQVDQFLSQGSTVQTGSGPYVRHVQHVTPAGGLGHGGKRWLWRLWAAASQDELPANGAREAELVPELLFFCRWSKLKLRRPVPLWFPKAKCVCVWGGGGRGEGLMVLMCLKKSLNVFKKKSLSITEPSHVPV